MAMVYFMWIFPKDVTIDGYELQVTCEACPELYDVFKDGVQVASFRLRNGRFSGSVPDAYGFELFSANPEGDGCFEDHEREVFLKEAVSILDDHLGGRENDTSSTHVRSNIKWRIYL